MAKKGLYKFRWKEQKHIAFDIAVMTAGLVMGVLAVTAVFKFTGFVDFGAAVDESGSLRGAAPLTAEAPVSASESDATFGGGAVKGDVSSSAETGASDYAVIFSAEQYSGYASTGQTDVSFFKFGLNPSASAVLKELRLDLDGYASAADVTSMQLYFENKLAGQAPVMDAQAKFENLSIELEPNTPHQFEIKANISSQARSGDRVQIGFKDSSGIIARDTALHQFEVKGIFPAWSGYISIIGKKKV